MSIFHAQRATRRYVRQIALFRQRIAAYPTSARSTLSDRGWQQPLDHPGAQPARRVKDAEGTAKPLVLDSVRWLCYIPALPVCIFRTKQITRQQTTPHRNPSLPPPLKGAGEGFSSPSCASVIGIRALSPFSGQRKSLSRFAPALLSGEPFGSTPHNLRSPDLRRAYHAPRREVRRRKLRVYFKQSRYSRAEPLRQRIQRLTLIDYMRSRAVRA